MLSVRNCERFPKYRDFANPDDLVRRLILDGAMPSTARPGPSIAIPDPRRLAGSNPAVNVPSVRVADNPLGALILASQKAVFLLTSVSARFQRCGCIC